MEETQRSLFDMTKSYDDHIVNSISNGEISIEEGMKMSTENLKRSLDSMNLPKEQIDGSPWLKKLSSSK